MASTCKIPYLDTTICQFRILMALIIDLLIRMHHTVEVLVDVNQRSILYLYTYIVI